MTNNLKEKLHGGNVTVGTWMSLGGLPAAEILADVGYDWLVIDMEHGAITIREAEDLIRHLDAVGCPPLVRVGRNDILEIRRVMDAGAHGVVVPLVRTAAEAEAAVAAVRYPPQGIRGVGLCRANRYGATFEEYTATVAERAVVVPQIEHVDGVEALEEILAVDGVDATIIGPYDLSASIGKPGAFDDPAVRELLKRYRSVSEAEGRTMGIHVVEPDPDAVLRRIDEGYAFIALSVDFRFLRVSSQAALDAVRRGREGS